MIGETTLPNKIPNLNQILFNGLKIFEFNSPKIKKTIEKKSNQILILPPLNNGYIEMIKKKIKKTIPKLLFEEILILFFSILIFYFIIFLKKIYIYYLILSLLKSTLEMFNF